MSHTEQLINKTTQIISEYLTKKYENYINSRKKRKGNSLKLSMKRLLRETFIKKFHHHIITVENYNAMEKKTYNFSIKNFSFHFYFQILANTREYDAFYQLLSDEESKKTYDWFVSYCIASAFLSYSDANTLFKPRITLDEMKKYMQTIPTQKDYFLINHYKLKMPKECIFHNYYALQYQYKEIVPKDDDIVFDVGAYYGDTAFWALSLLNDKGKVYSFEPFKENFEKLKENIEINSINNIIPINLAMDKQKGVQFMDGSDIMATVSNKGKTKIFTDTIDNIVQEHEIKKLDFIKMDIEGSELNALKGSENTIKKFAPDLAICVYHKADDFITIPKYIKELRNDYKLYLKNNSKSCLETVVYATIKNDF